MPGTGSDAGRPRAFRESHWPKEPGPGFRDASQVWQLVQGTKGGRSNAFHSKDQAHGAGCRAEGKLPTEREKQMGVLCHLLADLWGPRPDTERIRFILESSPRGQAPVSNLPSLLISGAEPEQRRGAAMWTLAQRPHRYRCECHLDPSLPTHQMVPQGLVAPVGSS